MDTKIQELSEKLDSKHVHLNEPLSKHTTLEIGGPADLYYEAQTKKDFVNAIKQAKSLGVPVTVLGWGSNVLIADQGLRGLVIRNMSKNIEILGDVDPDGGSKDEKIKVEERLDQPGAKAGKTQYVGAFNELDYDESDLPKVAVKLDAGVGLIDAINWTIEHDLTGLQWFARIPGNLGGVIYNNVHGGSHFISEYLDTVSVLDEQLEEQTLHHNDLALEYDQSRFHDTNEIILDAVFHLYKGDVEKAKFVVKEWGKRKIVQPWNSAGCTFANLTREQADTAYEQLSDEEKEQHGKSTSTGWFVEHVLKMKGFKKGNISIHEKHHNFIVNDGGGTAADYLYVLKEIMKRAREKGIELRPEIFLLGFSRDELEGVYSV